MKNTTGFTHWVIVILISVMAVGLVVVAWYYEENKEETTNNTSTTVNTNTTVANTNTTANTNTAVTNINSVINTNTVVDERTNWETYKNEEFGFSIDYPKQLLSNYGSCEWSEDKLKSREGNDHSYRPAAAMIPVKVFENTNTVYLANEYYYELTGQTVETEGVSNLSFFSGCEKVDNSIILLQGDQTHYQRYWEIISTTVNNDSDIENAIKERYGTGCRIGDKTPSTLQEGVYDVSILKDDDVKELQESDCPVNHRTILKYYPRNNLFITWNTGQAETFLQSLDPFLDYDLEMIESFRFIDN